MESSPMPSAVCAMSRSSGQRTGYSTSGSCTPTLSGLVIAAECIGRATLALLRPAHLVGLLVRREDPNCVRRDGPAVRDEVLIRLQVRELEDAVRVDVEADVDSVESDIDDASRSAAAGRCAASGIV